MSDDFWHLVCLQSCFGGVSWAWPPARGGGCLSTGAAPKVSDGLGEHTEPPQGQWFPFCSCSGSRWLRCSDVQRQVNIHSILKFWQSQIFWKSCHRSKMKKSWLEVLISNELSWQSNTSSLQSSEFEKFQSHRKVLAILKGWQTS